MIEEELQQARICVEKVSPEDKQKLQTIRYTAQSDAHASLLKAAFVSSKLWSPFSVLKIGFLNNNKVERTDTKKFGTSIDPIQKDIENLDSINSVKKVVMERIQPIVNLKIQFIKHKFIYVLFLHK